VGHSRELTRVNPFFPIRNALSGGDTSQCAGSRPVPGERCLLPDLVRSTHRHRRAGRYTSFEVLVYVRVGAHGGASSNSVFYTPGEQYEFYSPVCSLKLPW